MIPVRIKKPKKGRRKLVKSSAADAISKQPRGTIRIELSGCSVVIDGIVDRNTLTIILECLAK
jgi:hypothetical protein